ncbi:DUF1800 family protein [Thalassobium sp. R2A62]|jgi:uncharacterized protein (DUF1800 family)|uniref:DUF1800 domain-containing protein n=1 Tax=Thalassobium sp. R2A62 TaxID=633131 RepID=UPI0001B1D11D|nr:DUF1800 domain-containing protein [Thalassobium sp. R2A62]EET46848.1 hypothetical protein TR2A62_3360 [Thalassobium sp. R2A62]
MPFDPTLAAIRFGYGLSPTVAAPVSVDDMLAQARGPDEAGRAFRIPHMDQMWPSHGEFVRLTRLRRQNDGTEVGAQAAEDLKTIQRQVRVVQYQSFRAVVQRGVSTSDGLRERLVRFWADHFTAQSDRAVTRHLVAAYVEEAIRPHVMGRFSDMLRAVVTHPVMVLYLDQEQSMGPNSRQAAQRDRGLNENLAREVLELHTLGVGGPYSQDDVRQLAELMTGLSYTPQDGFKFRFRFAEPGEEIVLGRSYGGGAPQLDDILAAMDDLAAHPATAKHLARKLAVHFVSDTPEPALVSAVEQALVQTGGNLGAAVEALLTHDDAWLIDLEKVKQPFDFMLSSLRGLGVSPASVGAADDRTVRRLAERPLRVMGQPWEQPPGPDGWAEDAAAWITPQGMAGRITWAMQAPKAFVDPLPDPRDFVHTALGPYATQDIEFAANAAESVTEGIGLILSSPAFQRR